MSNEDVGDAARRRYGSCSRRRDFAQTGIEKRTARAGDDRRDERCFRRRHATFPFSATSPMDFLRTRNSATSEYMSRAISFSRSRAAGGANVQFVGRNAYYGMRLALSIEASHNVRIIKSTVDCFVIACPILFGLVITH